MNLHLWAIILPIIFLFYQIVIDSINLFPFNDVHVRDKRLRKYEVLGNYPPLLIISICFYFDGAWSWVGYGLTAFIMVMHLFAWWIPYFTGYPVAVRTDYEKYFSRTYKFLPEINDNIIPDAEHVGVGVLLLATLAVESLYLLS